MRRPPPASVILGTAIALAVPVAGPAAATTPGAAVSAVTSSARPGGVVRPAAAPAQVRPSPVDARIAAVLKRRSHASALGSRFTLTVWDSETGAYVFRKRATTSRRGASTTKILTAVGVLHTLGSTHRLPTRVKVGASAREVVLVAGGDPLLTSANLRSLARSTARALAPTAGSVAYTVRADDSLFAGTGRARGWNRGWLPRHVRPVSAFARDDRQVRDATADAGAYFASALRAAGVPATYGGEATAARGAATLASYPGHSVGKAVSRAVLVSDNDTAEMLFRLIAVGRGLPATWAGARRAQRAALDELGIPLAGVRVVDGSGLSLKGRLTARALTAALAAAISPRHPDLHSLRGWLPVAGRSGTLGASSGRFATKPARCAAGRIQAKTGTLADAIALAGYAKGADGRTKVFVAIVNRRPTRYTRTQTRTAMDKVAASVTGCW